MFAPGGGDDFIHDVDPLEGELIDVRAHGFDSLDDMTITDFGADTLVEFGDDSVTLVGFDDPSLLTADEFIFV